MKPVPIELTIFENLMAILAKINATSRLESSITALVNDRWQIALAPQNSFEKQILLSKR